MLSVGRRVRNGFRLLDKKLGRDWTRKIDVPKLDMGYLEQCILGQIFGTYCLGCRALALDDEAATLCGFNTFGRPRGQYLQLTAVWKTAIALRAKQLEAPKGDAAIASLKSIFAKELAAAS